MQVLYALESVRTPFFDTVMSVITRLGEETVFMVVALFVFWCVSKRHGYYLLAVGFAGTVLNQFLKLLCRLPRPWLLDSNFTIVESARAQAAGYSFPSGHAQNAVGTFGGIARFARRKWVRVTAIVIAVLVPFSRMYLGVHTPLDVGVAFWMALALLAALYPIFRSGEKTQKAMPYLLAAGIVLAGLFVLYVGGIRADFLPGSEDESNLSHAVKNAWTLLGAIAGLLVVFFHERRTGGFETRAPLLGQVLKFTLGLALVAGVKAALKPAFYALLPAGPADCVRYFLVVLLAGCIFPKTFVWFAKLGKNREAR